MPSPLNAYPITAYAWVNSLGTARWASTDDAAPNVAWLEQSGLEPAPSNLPFRAFWGRVHAPLPALPERLAGHDSRSARLWYAALTALLPELKAAVSRWGAARVGLVLGSSTGGIDRTEEALAHARRTGVLPDAYDFLEQHTYDALVRLTRAALGTGGPAFVISTACSSSGKALATAQRLLETGQCDAVVAGGADALCQMTLRGFASLGILSSEACKPFDAERNGITIGEGSAVLLVEREGASELALLSAGESGDAYHTTAPHPEGLGAKVAMERALLLAGLSPSDVGYVNAHGTGTKQNDAAEAAALSAVLSPAVRFSSTKDRVGHQLGAAGATEAAFCLDALRLGRLPGNRPPSVRDDELAVQPLVASDDSSVDESAIDCVLSNSFAFGGNNVSVALGRRRLSSQKNNVVLPGRAWLRAVAFWAPGQENLDALLSGRHEEQVQKPPAELLPVRARGRASQLTRLSAELLGQLTAAEPSLLPTLATVYGSAFGEMATTRSLLDQVEDPGGLSPAKFQSSVHNTAAGQLSIATGNREFSTALAAGEETVAMSLLEAFTYLALHGGDAAVMIADEDASSLLLPPDIRFPAAGVGFLLRWAEQPPPDALGTLTQVEPMTGGCVSSAAHGALGRTTAAWGVELARAAARRERGRFAVAPRWGVAFEPL